MTSPVQRDGIRSRSRRGNTAVSTVLAFAFAVQLPAQTVVNATWIGGTGNTNVLANWLGVTAVPSNGNGGVNYNWIIDGNTTSNSTATVNASATIHGLTISSGDALNVANAISLMLVGIDGAGTINNAGTISLAGGGNLTDLILNSGTFTFSGAGTLSLSNSANNRIYGFGGTGTLTNASGHTIQGSGQLGVDLLRIINEGSIVANQPVSLIVDPNASGITNTGTLRATNSATLVLQNGSIANTGGIIRAEDASHVTLSAVGVTGGTLTTEGTGAIRAINSSTLANITVSSGSRLEIPNAAGLNLSGTVQNFGTIAMLGGGNLTDLVVAAGGATLTGGGSLTLSNSANNRIYGAGGAGTLVNEDNTIGGAGQIGVSLLKLDNRATIEANISGATLEINPGSGGLVNSGTLRAANGGVLRLESGSFTSTLGALHAADGSRIDLSGATITGGTLSTAGSGVIRTVSGNTFGGAITLTFGSTLNVINATSLTLLSSGTYTNNGTLAMGAAGNLTDLILSGGNVSLDGTGTLSLSNSVNNRIYGAPATNTLTNTLQHTIQGSGQLGVDLMGLVNQGAIVANQVSDLTIDPGASGVTNSGTLRAESGATLRLQGGSFVNTGAGSMRAVGTNSVVEFSGAAVSGGQLFSDVGAALRNVSASSYANVTLLSGSSLQILNATSATLAGTITNQGDIAMQAAGNLTDLLISGGDVRLEGGGTISLSNRANNRIYGTAATNRLINVDHVIRGSGQLGVNLLGLVNQSSIIANQTTALVIDPASGGVTNTGLLAAESGATLELQNGSFNNAGGTISASGTGSRVNFENATVTGGMLLAGSGGILRNTAGSTFTDLALGTGTTLQILNATTGTFNGLLTNAGTVQMLATANLTDFIVGAGGLTLLGGVVDLSNSPNNRIYGTSGSTLLNDGGTIRGAGQLGVNLLRLDNRGTIEAGLSAGTLTLDPNAGGFSNTGLMTATNGGILRLESGTFSNAGGVISAGSGSRVDLASAVVQGGLLSGTTFRNAANSTLNAVSISGGTVVEVPNASTFTLLGTIVNAGTVRMQTIGNLTDMVVGSGGASLAGGGVIELSNSANNRIYGATAAVTLNNVDNTIRGSGQLGVNQLTLLNTGTIEANQSNPLTVNLSAAFTNGGTLRATTGGNLVFLDALTNAGAVWVDAGSTFTAQSTFTQTTGFIVLDGGTFNASSSNLQSGGAMVGTGTISGGVSNSGVIAPGGATALSPDIGQLTFNHALTLSPTSLLHLELAGPSSFDRLQAPTAALGGTLGVTFTNGFGSAVTALDSFTLLTTTNATGLTGTFDGLAHGSRFFTADGLGSFQISYAASSFTLSNFVPVPEPSTYLLFGVGALIVALVSRRRS